MGELLTTGTSEFPEAGWLAGGAGGGTGTAGLVAVVVVEVVVVVAALLAANPTATGSVVLGNMPGQFSEQLGQRKRWFDIPETATID
jgi:hypothetical protein